MAPPIRTPASRRADVRGQPRATDGGTGCRRRRRFVDDEHRPANAPTTGSTVAAGRSHGDEVGTRIVMGSEATRPGSRENAP